MDITSQDGRAIRTHETGPPDGRPVLWFHPAGTRGDLAAPLPALARKHGVRLVGLDRPGYGGSAPHDGRTVLDGARDAITLLDGLGIGRADVLGLGAGGAHALALAAAEPGRVRSVTAISTPAPFDADGLDWFAGAGPLAAGETRAATQGRDALVAFLGQDHEFDIRMFSFQDIDSMRGPWWEWQQKVADPGGIEGVVGDDLALVAPWGVDLTSVATPVRLVHGAQDTFVPVAHARWLADRIPGAELSTVPGGTISTIRQVEEAISRIAARPAD